MSQQTGICRKEIERTLGENSSQRLQRQIAIDRQISSNLSISQTFENQDQNASLDIYEEIRSETIKMFKENNGIDEVHCKISIKYLKQNPVDIFSLEEQKLS